MKASLFVVSLLGILVSGSAAWANQHSRCQCSDFTGQVVCAPEDFGIEPGGYNVPGSPDPVAYAQQVCRDLHPELDVLFCSCGEH